MVLSNMSQCSTMIKRESDIEFITNSPWRTYIAHLEGPHWEIKATMKAENKEGPGPHASNRGLLED